MTPTSEATPQQRATEERPSVDIYDTTKRTGPFMRRRLTLAQWQRLSNNTSQRPRSWRQLFGISPGAAAARLGITRSSVQDAMQRGDLERIEVRDPAGVLCWITITERSIVWFQMKREGHTQVELAAALKLG